MSYFIGIAIAIVVFIILVFLGKMLIIFFAKKIAVTLAKKAAKNATQYAKDQFQTLMENKEEESKK